MRENLTIVRDARQGICLSFVIFCLLIAGIPLMSGCNRGVSDEELGEIHYSLPKIPGAEKPTPLPPFIRHEHTHSEEQEPQGGEPTETSPAKPASIPEQPVIEELPTVEDAAPAESD